MIGLPARRLQVIGSVFLVVLWAVLAHLGSSSAADGWLVLPGTLPLLAAVLLLFWRRSHPVRSVILLVLLLIVLAWSWPLLSRNLALLYFLQHFGINLALGAFFGRTLFIGPPLITRLAALVHDRQLSERQLRYTRQATQAWTAFFVANAVLSVALFALAPIVVWSIFANLLAMPLLGAMFVVEHVWRTFALPPDERPSIAQVIQASRRVFGGQSAPAGAP